MIKIKFKLYVLNPDEIVEIKNILPTKIVILKCANVTVSEFFRGIAFH